MCLNLPRFFTLKLLSFAAICVAISPLAATAQQGGESGGGGNQSCDCPPPPGFGFQCQGNSALKMVDSDAGHDCIQLPVPVSPLCPNGQVLQGFDGDDGSKTCVPSSSPANFACANGRVLQRVNTFTGERVCVDLPPAPEPGRNFECGNGRVLKKVNTANGEKQCVDIPPALPESVSCPNGKVLTGFTATGQPTCKEAAVELHSCRRVQQDNFDHCVCPPGEVMTMHNADAVGPSEYHGFRRPVHPTAGRMLYQATCDCCKIRIKLQ